MAASGQPVGADTGPAPIDSPDVAWVRVPTLFTPAELARHCSDTEVLFRINPYLYFRKWTETGPGRFHIEAQNQSNNQMLSLDLTRTATDDNGFEIRYDSGLKRRTVFLFEPTAQGCTLVVADDYGHLSEEERKTREAGIDRSLVAWGVGLGTYLARLRRWSWLPGWRTYMRRLWIPMTPSARRIVWLLYLIAVVEFLFFLFVLLIYVVEQYK